MAAFVMFRFHERRQLRRERVFKDRKNPMETFTDEEIYNNFRFHRQHVLFLCDQIKETIDFPLRRKGWVPPLIQVLVALKFYATGTFHSVVGELFGISIATNHRIVHRVTGAFLAVAKFQLPHGRDIQKTKASFYSKAGMPNVVGCIDCTHIKILAPSENEHEYVNRKMTHSINVQVVCDASMRVTNLVSKWPGSVHDARILRNSGLFAAFEDTTRRPIDGIILGDSGYMLRDWLFTPVQNPCNRAEEAYNTAHRITRCSIERVIGVVKRRWHSLHAELRMTPERACKVIFVCFWLHNIAVEAGLPMEYESGGDNTDDADNPTLTHTNDTPTERDRHAAGKAARLALIHRVFSAGRSCSLSTSNRNNSSH